MKRFFMVAIAALFCIPALADNGNLTFTNPTQLMNDTPFSASQIAGYDIACTFKPVGGVKAACATYSPQSTSTGALTAITVTLTISSSGGDACFMLVLRSTQNGNSDPSSEACKTFGAVRPKPVNGLQVVQVTIEVPNWSIAFNVNQQGQKTDIVSGFVKVSTPCTGEKLYSYRGQNYYRFLLTHPTRNTSNVAWLVGVNKPYPDISAPCA